MSCAVESRSHIAGMSPVTMKIVPSGMSVIVVDSVFAKQFANTAPTSDPIRSSTCRATLPTRSACI
ncbi:hypothetical protein [Curtobacterium sp. MCPF17_052]|uniref:hypothetical protein n=1 Tax=Curtobacterium sp. MCPF17_052 TaxID=2175655 RepID=UPI0024DFF303|nr:hypothetical protein [Curtobacterium sp. MCPF17_052]WIB14080.1 hypothetical protein DEJ36_02760 [Curtobacterium sp. MCPF17_052]